MEIINDDLDVQELITTIQGLTLFIVCIPASDYFLCSRDSEGMPKNKQDFENFEREFNLSIYLLSIGNDTLRSYIKANHGGIDKAPIFVLFRGQEILIKTGRFAIDQLRAVIYSFLNS
jgi:hypothetical protein